VKNKESKNQMSLAKELLQIILSWPTVALVAIIVFMKQLSQLVDRLIRSDTGKARIGPVEIELGKLAEQGQQAVDKLNRINYLMAESRLLELQITEAMPMFSMVSTEEHRSRMTSQIEELKKLTKIT
jgi:hypothetical protein